jgi:hypothetical protein
MPEVKAAKAKTTNVIVYEYGARLDRECAATVDDQIRKAHQLYNDLIALMRDTVAEMQSDLLSKAGPEAQQTQLRLDDLNARFAEAKARDDEASMKEIAQTRREAWVTLATQLKAARTALKSDHQAKFFSRIGKKSTCGTYQMRSQAVANGLGWGTANAILDNALIAFGKSIKQGRAPRFASAAEKVQDTLTLQFTMAGGLPATDLLGRRQGDFVLTPPVAHGARKYGEYRFRLGAATADTYATGTWQYHRPLPAGASVGVARLIRRRIGKDVRYAIQLQLTLRDSIEHRPEGRKPLATVHFGWAADLSGRRVAGIADSAEPGLARIVALPPEIEEGLLRTATLRAERDTARDQIVPIVKKLDSTRFEESLEQEIAAINRLPTNHVAIRRLHRLCYQLRTNDALPAELDAWRKADRLRWQNEAHLARRARNRRRDFYRNFAIELARGYEVIAIEPLDLAKAAAKLDERTGEKTEFAKKARSGRVVAAIYELESAIRWAAVKTGAAVLELTAETASACSICGGVRVLPDAENSQILHCPDCGADLDRKQNGAALAYQLVMPEHEDAALAYHADMIEAQREAEERKRDRLGKMAKSRAAARIASEVKTP